MGNMAQVAKLTRLYAKDGACSAGCHLGSIQQRSFMDRQILPQIAVLRA